MVGTVVGSSDTGSVIGAKLVPVTGAEFFGLFSRTRSSPPPFWVMVVVLVNMQGGL